MFLKEIPTVLSACNTQAGAEIEQISADFERGRFETGSTDNLFQRA